MEEVIESKLKKTKLGEIPYDWEIGKIKDFTDYVDYRGKTPLKTTKGIFLITAKNIKNGYIDYKISREFISEDDYDNVMSRGKPSKGDVLITTEAPMGNVAQVDRTDVALAQRIIKYSSSSENLSNDYLKWFLLSPAFQKELDLESTGTTVKGIKGSRLHKIPIILPPLKEQQKIAKILSTWDQAINKTQKLIEQLELRKKGLMQELLTGKKRLPGFDGEWKKFEIGEVAQQFTDKNSDNKISEVLSCTKYDGLVRSLEYFGRKVYGDDLTKYKVVPRNYFAYATNHIEEGSIGYQNLIDAGLVSPMYTVFKTNDKVDDSYLFRLLKTDRMIYYYQSNMSGSVARRGGLRWSAFKELIVKLPAIQEQKAIAALLNEADTEINLQSEHLESLKNQKKGLMQQLLTGKKRVKI